MMNPVRAESKAQHKATAMHDAVCTGIFMKYLLSNEAGKKAPAGIRHF
jgi:hypothetical protein